MSRIGRKPVTIPAGVTITLDGTKVTVKGPKGTLERNIDKHLSVKIEGTELLVTRPDDSISMKMIHGTTRALIQNMVDGVSNGFSKDLEIRGVGYKCEMQGKNLVLHVGHSHADTIVPPEGVAISTGKNMSIKVEGIDKELVGQVAANIRNVKKPEPYHGKVFVTRMKLLSFVNLLLRRRVPLAQQLSNRERKNRTCNQYLIRKRLVSTVPIVKMESVELRLALVSLSSVLIDISLHNSLSTMCL